MKVGRALCGGTRAASTEKHLGVRHEGARVCGGGGACECALLWARTDWCRGPASPRTKRTRRWMRVWCWRSWQPRRATAPCTPAASAPVAPVPSPPRLAERPEAVELRWLVSLAELPQSLSCGSNNWAGFTSFLSTPLRRAWRASPNAPLRYHLRRVVQIQWPRRSPHGRRSRTLRQRRR